MKGRFRKVTWLGLDILFLSASLYAAFWLRFDGAIPAVWLARLPFYILLACAVKLGLFWYFGLYHMLWGRVGIRELLRVAWAILIGQAGLGAFYFFAGREMFLWTGFPPLPRSVWLLDGVLSFLLIGFSRSAHRIYTALRQDWTPTSGRKHLLLVGAGDAGVQILRLLQEQYLQWYRVVGFLDDDPAKYHAWIHGVQVLGPRRLLPQLVTQERIDEIWITMPSAPASVIQETIHLAREAGIKHIRVLPPLAVLLRGRLNVTDVREIRLEDVLGRDPVAIDVHIVENLLKGKVVLVTGAAGSIGSELCHRILRFQPKVLCALDQDESGLFNLELHLRDEIPPQTQLQLVVADICDAPRIQDVFRKVRPDVVFHAAAYKHVPLMEHHPQEAVKTNVLGTRIVAEAALDVASETFVLISTDKAVNPTSVMGATKRVAEILIQFMQRRAQREGKQTRFVTVRFGNVLGSRGSVFPIFQMQIQKGGPVTVTHPEMRRYFMLPSEAALLVLQAGAMGQGGEVFVLDMGEPIRILDLAREMIHLAGYEPDVDIPIVFTGVRPGEKLFEELLTAEEGTEVSEHERILIAQIHPPENETVFLEQLDQLVAAAYNNQIEDIHYLLKLLVPSYHT